jgi:hypothetical protein
MEKFYFKVIAERATRNRHPPPPDGCECVTDKGAWWRLERISTSVLADEC